MPDGIHEQFAPPDPSTRAEPDDSYPEDHTRQLPVVLESPRATSPKRRKAYLVVAEIVLVGALIMFGFAFIQSAIRNDNPRSAPSAPDPVTTEVPLTGSTIALSGDPYAASSTLVTAFTVLLATRQFDLAAVETGGRTDAAQLEKWFDTDAPMSAHEVSVDVIARNRYTVRAVLVESGDRAADDLPEVLCARFDVDPTSELVQVFEPIILTDSSLQTAEPLLRSIELCAQARLA